MRVVYVSSLISKSKLEYIIKNAKNKPLQSIQKFHRLICEGFVANNIKVKAISAIPMSRKICKKVCWFEKKEIVNNIEYEYLPFFNIKILRQVCMFLGIIIKIVKECFNKDTVFICDLLNTTIATTTLIMSKILRQKCVAIVTDLPRDIGEGHSISKKINEYFQNRYDGYIILTKYMNEVINKKNKPYVVIEGIADISYLQKEDKYNKYANKVLLYAGGLYEKYGVKALIEAILQLKNNNVELHLYGSGEMESYIQSLDKNKIKYFGVVTNDIVLEAENKATLLINPRFSNEEYTKYSFPSKNIEYMSTGTPVLTTRLAGMPEEYQEFVYFFEDESVEGYTKTIENILLKSDKELLNKGKEAKQFIINKKNNIIQTNLIIKKLYEITKEEKSKK